MRQCDNSILPDSWESEEVVHVLPPCCQMNRHKDVENEAAKEDKAGRGLIKHVKEYVNT